MWQTPNVTAWADWVDMLWTEISHEQPETLLASHQLKAVWTDIIKHSSQANQLLNPANTATMAAKAYDLLKQWNLDLAAVADTQHPDVEAFSQWARSYEQRCRQHSWIDPHTQLAQLTDQIVRGRFPLPPQIIWLGFDALTPQQQRLMAAQRHTGSQVSEEKTHPARNQALCHPCNDNHAELTSAAAWTQQRLGQSQDSRIAIVVPDLAERRNDVTRIFDEALCPGAALKLTDEIDRPYNLSYGTPLAETPIIAAALDLLSLVKSPVELPVLGRLIQSPHLAGAEQELGARARYDHQLRSLGGARYSLENMANTTLPSHRHCPPKLADLFAALLASKESLPHRQRPSHWALSFRHLLDASGWPGERPLSSPEFQATDVWRTLLGTFATLDTIISEIDFSEAINHLKQMAADHPFQLKTASSRVQILGLLEAAGLDFDHLWITGLHDGVWPAPAKPNPFLPVRLQQQQAMPHACAERELRFAQELTQRLLGSAKEIIVSYPRRDGDRDLRPSPLIKALKQSDIDIPHLSVSREKIYRSQIIEMQRDWQATPLAKGEKVSGGSALLTDQAACPFRAFAYHRLAARPLPEATSGLTPAQRGSLLHHVLELFWRDLEGQTALLALSETAQQRRLDLAITQALAKEAKRQPHRFTKRFTALEYRRLIQLLHSWLEVERQRQPFTLVSSEEKRRVEIGGLNVDIKADRIDRIDNDGGEMIIDYKTGIRKAKAWFGPRPDEPQLPLYAVTHKRPVIALAFATLRPDGCSLEGVSTSVEVAKGIVDIGEKKESQAMDWNEQMEQWHETLTSLANDFRNGRAEVDPKNRTTSCTYCGLSGLCRIDEISS